MILDDDTPQNEPDTRCANLEQAINEEDMNCCHNQSDIQLETPAEEAEDQPVTLYRAAGFWIRLLAFGIDLAVIACLNGIISEALFSPNTRQSLIYGIIHQNALFLGLTGAAYFIFMTYYYQQTLGKMIAGIQVIQRSGKPLSWTTVIFRELVARSLSQLMGLNLGYIFCWFNADKRCLHDFLSDTWVVHVTPNSHPGLIAVESTAGQ